VDASGDARDHKDEVLSVEDATVEEESPGRVGRCQAIIVPPYITGPKEGVEEIQAEGRRHLVLGKYSGFLRENVADS
jgi:hypothetical protein